MSEPLGSKIQVFKEEISEYGRESENSFTSQEIEAALRVLGHETTGEVLEDMMQKLNLADDKVAEPQDGQSVTAKRIRFQVALEELIETFRVFDKDNNGLILTSELKLVMNSVGERLTRPEIEEIIKEGNPNLDDYMNYEQFVRRVLVN